MTDVTMADKAIMIEILDILIDYLEKDFASFDI